CTAEAVRTVAPPAFEIAEESIRKSLPAKLRRSLPPVAETSALRVDVPFVGEAALLARSMPKAPRTPSIVELDDVDAGWEASKAPSAAPAPAPGRRPLPKKIVRKRS